MWDGGCSWEAHIRESPSIMKSNKPRWDHSQGFHQLHSDLRRSYPGQSNELNGRDPYNKMRNWLHNAAAGLTVRPSLNVYKKETSSISENSLARMKEKGTVFPNEYFLMVW